MSSTVSSYRGRFAPSPSGRLHLGSALTAYASYLRARSEHGTFIIRIEDLDKPRCPDPNTAIMLKELEALGLNSDEPVLIQSEDTAVYEDTIASIPAAYACTCTRSMLKERPCTCVSRGLPPQAARDQKLRYAVRIELEKQLKSHPNFLDLNFGRIEQNRLEDPLSHSLILRRSDGIIAYNLAVVVDDHRQGITEVVRGADMLSATFLQLALYDVLGFTAPKFLHLPLISDPITGLKLSKQNHAPALLDLFSPLEALRICLDLLNIIPDKSAAALLKERSTALHQGDRPATPAGSCVPAVAAAAATSAAAPVTAAGTNTGTQRSELETLLDEAVRSFDIRKLPHPVFVL